MQRLRDLPTFRRVDSGGRQSSPNAAYCLTRGTPVATARFLTFIVYIKDIVGRYAMRYQFSPTTWFLGIRFRSLGLCPGSTTHGATPPRAQHHNLIKLVADVISENPGPHCGTG